MGVHLTSSHVVPASREVVWRMLQDPEILRRCIPGCRSFDEVKRDSYRAVMRLRIAPMLAGNASGTIAVVRREAPERLLLRIRGGGGPLKASGAGAIRLVNAPKGTAVLFEGDLAVKGTLAGMAERVAPAVAKRLSSDFFANLDRVAQRLAR